MEWSDGDEAEEAYEPDASAPNPSKAKKRLAKKAAEAVDIRDCRALVNKAPPSPPRRCRGPLTPRSRTAPRGRCG